MVERKFKVNDLVRIKESCTACPQHCKNKNHKITEVSSDDTSPWPYRLGDVGLFKETEIDLFNSSAFVKYVVVIFDGDEDTFDTEKEAIEYANKNFDLEDGESYHLMKIVEDTPLNIVKKLEL